MSGSGGFYKYRCKYWNTDPIFCPNWIYVNGHACAVCLASGYENDTPPDGEPQPDGPNTPVAINSLAGSCHDSMTGAFGHDGSPGDNLGMAPEKDEHDPGPVPCPELPRPSRDGTWNQASK